MLYFALLTFLVGVLVGYRWGNERLRGQLDFQRNWCDVMLQQAKRQ